MPKKKKKDDKSNEAEAEAKAQAEQQLKQRRELAAKAASRTVDGLEHVLASLPRDLIERARQQFTQCDKDGSGAIDRHELPGLLSALGLSMGPEQFTSFVESSPALSRVDDDGLISCDEYLSVYCQCVAPNVRFGERLRQAAARGEAAAVTELLSRGCHPGFSDAAGYTAMHYASQCGNLECLQQMSDKFGDTCDWDCPDKTGWSPLAVAAHAGHQDVVTYLLEIGADPCSQDLKGRTCLHHAAAGGRHAVLEQLLQDEDGPEAAQLADAAGWTPLHVACLHGHSKCAETLLSTMSTASIAAEDALGRSAMAVASPKLDPAIAHKLADDLAAGETSAGYGTQAAAGTSRALLAAVARLDAMPREDYESLLAAEAAGAPVRSLQSRAAAKQRRRASTSEGGCSSASNGAASGGAGSGEGRQSKSEAVDVSL